MEDIFVSSTNSYNILVGENLLKKTGYFIKQNINNAGFNIVIITDSLVCKIYGGVLKKSLMEFGFSVFMFAVPNKESSKNFSCLLEIYNFLVKCGITKKDIIIALGGGVVCDISGFVACTYLRGIRYINIPTTLLSQVDASIGGKNGVNFGNYKNLIGTIYSPSLIICDIFLLKTLKEKVFLSGFGEVIKYAVTFSKELFNILCEQNKNIYSHLKDIIIRCIKIKKNVIQIDEFEKNIRTKLNFGHTIGHALERYFNNSISHGEAVCVGMCYITEKSVKAGITSLYSFLKLKNLIKKYNLPTALKFNVEDIFKSVLKDKKIFGNVIRICVVKKIGHSVILTMPILKFRKFLNM